jgi:signal peptide peptidase SppA
MTPDILALFAVEQWAMLPEALDACMARYALSGSSLDPLADAKVEEEGVLRGHPVTYHCASDDGETAAEYDRALMAAAPKAAAEAGRTVAVVPVIGPITKRDSFMSMFFGGTSVNRLVAQLRTLRNDESVSAVVLNVDSPGGSTSGMPELAAEIRALRESKKVVAICNDLAASGGYWIASQADEVVATPEARVGSVGVYMLHVDQSKALEAAGITPTFISAGKFKTEGNPYEPLSDEAKAHAQTIVDAHYQAFVGDVATGRNVPAATVRSDYGQGRVLVAKDAKAAGMIDRIDSYTGVIAALAGARRPVGPRADATLTLTVDTTEALAKIAEAQAAADHLVETVASVTDEDETRRRRARQLYGAQL